MKSVQFFIFLLLISVKVEKSLEIINGNTVGIEFFPWTAIINMGYWLPEYHDFVCGGVIIHPRWVLSAAHCVPEDDLYWGAYYFIRAGTIAPTWGGAKIDIEKPFYRYPEYNSSSYAHDIVLLKLQEKFDISNEIQIVPMIYEEFNVTENLTTAIAGYGEACTFCGNQNLRYIFLETCIPICIPRYECENVCAIDPEEKRGISKLDSGRGLVVFDGFEPFLLEILNHQTTEFCNIRFPALFSSIPFYGKWIKQTIAMHDDFL